MFAVSPYTPDDLASVLSEQQDNALMAAMGGSSYEMTNLNHDEMLNYAPGGITPAYPNPASYPASGVGGLGVSDSWTSFNWLIFAGVGLGLYFYMHSRQPGY